VCSNDRWRVCVKTDIVLDCCARRKCWIKQEIKQENKLDVSRDCKLCIPNKTSETESTKRKSNITFSRAERKKTVFVTNYRSSVPFPFSHGQNFRSHLGVGTETWYSHPSYIGQRKDFRCAANAALFIRIICIICSLVTLHIRAVIRIYITS
jgi:hypothetical protein